MRGATQWAIVHEEGGKPGIEVFVPLSEPEQRAVQDHLNRRGTPEVPGLSLSSYLNGIVNI